MARSGFYEPKTYRVKKNDNLPKRKHFLENLTSNKQVYKQAAMPYGRIEL